MASELVQQIQSALNRLGDPSYLEVHPLAPAAPADLPGGTPGARLRHLLVAVVDQLRPGAAGDGRGADGVHRLLEQRYVAGRSVVAVCRDLGITDSEYYRRHRRAVDALAALVEQRLRRPAQPAEPSAAAPDGSAGAPRTNLPHRSTSFVGRESEIAETRRLLADVPLLTIVGPPGIGKTRLALEAASGLADAYPDGVWLVDLAALTEPALVPPAVARVLGVREGGGQTLDQALAAHLRGRRLLLVLDNCEHLVDACAGLLDGLLRLVPSARVLATSREALRVDGEVAYRLAPLPLPPEGAAISPAELVESAAGELFVMRGRALDPTLASTAAEAAVAARICRRLDGIALAIELAAARVGALTLEEIERRLDDRFRLLTAGRRTALPRQQTLAALIDFSHDLLPAPDRALLRRLGAFAGPFTLESAKVVCAGGDVPADEVIDQLASLVDKSLVVFDRADARYRLLETIRAYAAARLAEAGELDTVHARQRDRLLALADEAEPHLTRGDAERARWVGAVERELDDVRATLRWCLAHDAEAAARLCVRLLHFWWEKENQREGLGWLREALACTEADSPSRPRALMAAGFLARLTDEPILARELAEASRPLLLAAGDRAGAARTLENLGMIAWADGDRDRAEQLFAESVGLARQADDGLALGGALRGLGLMALGQGDDRRAEPLLEESLAVLRAAGDQVGVAQSLGFLGEVAAGRGDVARARELFGQAIAAGREARYSWGEAFNMLRLGRALYLADDLPGARATIGGALALLRRIAAVRTVSQALRYLGDVARAERDHAAADALYGESLAVAREMGATPEAELALIERAELARRQGELTQAGALLRDALPPLARIGQVLPAAYGLAVAAAVRIDAGAAAEGVRLAATARAVDPLLGSRHGPCDRACHEALLAGARRALGDTGFAAAWAEGEKSSLADAARLAL